MRDSRWSRPFTGLRLMGLTGVRKVSIERTDHATTDSTNWESVAAKHNVPVVVGCTEQDGMTTCGSGNGGGGPGELFG